MNNSFPRILTLLRKERKLSQKQVAKDLGISQALLSHYEKGIRECGLEFLVRVSEYYNVSCDYLLGKTTNRSGNTVILSSQNETEESASEKLIQSGVSAVLKMADKFECPDLKSEVLKYFKLIIYNTFRILYSSNSKNSQRIFSIDSKSYATSDLAQMIISENKIYRLAKGENVASQKGALKSSIPIFSAESITDENEKYAETLMQIVNEIESP